MPATFATTSTGLRRGLAPMLLFEKAKRLGVWNPSDIDFGQDKRDWKALSSDEQDLLLRLTSLFVAGEEAVTRDLLPLIRAAAQQGCFEDELYLTSFLWEEAKHVDFFSRFLTEVCGAPGNLDVYHGLNYKRIVCEALPEAMAALERNPSPQALARASSVYNMIVEGMLAETGYHAYFTIMDRAGILPGQRGGIAKLKLDESRHIAYGVYLLSRLIAQDPAIWEAVEATMQELLEPGLGVINEIFACYDPMPFGINLDEFLAYAASQFQKRLDRVRRACSMNLEEVNSATLAVITADDA